MKRYSLMEYLVFSFIIGIFVLLAVWAISDGRARMRDAKRLADIKQIQASLELYFNDHNSYPVAENAISLGEGIDCQGQPCLALSSRDGFVSQGDAQSIMPLIPTNPQPSGMAYKYVSNGQTYFIQFSLEKSIGTLASGLVCASPQQLKNGACQ